MQKTFLGMQVVVADVRRGHGNAGWVVQAHERLEVVTKLALALLCKFIFLPRVIVVAA